MRNYCQNDLKITKIYSSLDKNEYIFCKLLSEKTKYIYGSYLKFKQLKNSDKPIIVASFVSSIDGKITFNQDLKGCPIASANSADNRGRDIDFWLMMMLRASSDAVIIGTGTLNLEENAIGIIYDNDLSLEREQNGLSKNPISIIVSRSGKSIPYNHKIFNLDTSVILLTSKQGLKFITTHIKQDYYLVKNTESQEKLQNIVKNNQDKIGIIAVGDRDIDNQLAGKILKQIGIDIISCEASVYTHLLIKDKMLDEIFLNYSGIYIGGNAKGIANSLPDIKYNEVPHCQMLSIHTSTPYFFYTRQRFIYENE